MTIRIESSIATITLRDPAKRNALSLSMFDAIGAAVAQASNDNFVRVVHLRGDGNVFCAGFDLEAVVDDPLRMATFIERLSDLLRSLRRMPHPVVASVQGAAIAGGCAILSACDFVVVEANAQLGYPVHQIGISPAVTLPTLTQAIGHGHARTLVVSGELIDGREAYRIGLATDLAEGAIELESQSAELTAHLARKPPQALRITKGWMNELDGSQDDERFDGPVRSSRPLAETEEAIDLLRTFWSRRR